MQQVPSPASGKVDRWEHAAAHDSAHCPAPVSPPTITASGIPSAQASIAAVSRDAPHFCVSARQTVAGETPALRASSVCVQPRAFRSRSRDSAKTSADTRGAPSAAGRASSPAERAPASAQDGPAPDSRSERRPGVRWRGESPAGLPRRVPQPRTLRIRLRGSAYASATAAIQRGNLPSCSSGSDPDQASSCSMIPTSPPGAG